MALLQVDTAGDLRVDITSLLTTTGAWTNLDLSSHINSDSTGVYILVTSDGTPVADWYFDLRNDGSTDAADTAKDLDVDAAPGWWPFHIGVTSQICEYYIGAAVPSGVKVWLLGQWGPGATFVTNATNYNVTSASTYEDIDITTQVGGDAGSVIAAIVKMSRSLGTTFAVRAKGGTDTYDGQIRFQATTIVKVDSNDVFQGFASNTSGDFDVLGWITSDFTSDTNVTDVAITADSTTRDYGFTWDTSYPFGMVLFHDGASNLDVGFRPDGETWTEIDGEPVGHKGIIVPVPLVAGVFEYIAESGYDRISRVGHSSAQVASSSFLPGYKGIQRGVQRGVLRGNG